MMIRGRIAMSEPTRKVLMVSRDFSPTLQVGVERIIKFAKYLPEYGWEPSVITGATPSFGFKNDYELAKDVADVEVLKCFVPDVFRLFANIKTRILGQDEEQAVFATRVYKQRGPWHPKSLIVPDSQALWAIPAYWTARKHQRRFNWDVVYATLSPPTNAVAAYLISKRLGIPLLVDYRDPWTDAFFSPKRLGPLAKYEKNLEARIFASADAVTTLDRMCIKTPLAAVDSPPPIRVIPNGYDDSDFTGVPKELPRWSIVHTGNLHKNRPLTNIWSIVNEAIRLNPELRGQIHFWQVGTVDEFVMQQLDNPPDGLNTHYVPPVPMKQAIEYMMGAHMLLVMSASSENVIAATPAKIYQYLRANRPILALIEPGVKDLVDTAHDANESYCCDSTDYSSAARYLVERFRATDSNAPQIGAAIQKYSRRRQTGELAEMLQVAKDSAG